jgi:YfiH family protein
VRRLRQVHGDAVVLADAAWPLGAPGGFPAGDALVGRGADHVLAVVVADCAAVALATEEGAHGAVHAGWRGLRAGVVEKAVRAVSELGTGAVVAGLGPCIGPCCYEFAGPALEELAGRYGDAVRATTAWGAPALDLPAAVRGALAAAGAQVVVDQARCSGCDPQGFWSHRRRGDRARQALFVWRLPER